MSTRPSGPDRALRDLLTGDGPAAAVVVGPAPSTFATGAVVRRVDGAGMRTVAGVLAALAAAWEFPAHFGNNRDALDDCMRNLPTDLFTAEGTPARAYLTVVEGAGALLADAPDDCSWFAESADFWRDHQRDAGRGFAILLSADASGADDVRGRFAADDAALPTLDAGER